MAVFSNASLKLCNARLQRRDHVDLALQRTDVGDHSLRTLVVQGQELLVGEPPRCNHHIDGAIRFVTRRINYYVTLVFV